MVERLILMLLWPSTAYRVSEGILEEDISSKGVRVAHVESGKQTDLAEEAEEPTSGEVGIALGLEVNQRWLTVKIMIWSLWPLRSSLCTILLKSVSFSTTMTTRALMTDCSFAL